MTRLLVHQLDYLLFIEGLFLIASAFMAEVLRRDDDGLPWAWFVLFASAQGLARWAGLLPLVPESHPSFELARELFVPLAAAALVPFGRLLAAPRATAGGAGQAAAGAFLVLGLSWSAEGFRAVSYCAGLLCAAGATGSLWRARGRRPGFGHLALALGAYAVSALGAPFATASAGLLSLVAPSDVAPLASLLRAAFATWLAWTVWRHARRARPMTEQGAEALLGRPFPAWIGAALALSVAGGWVLSERFGDFARADLFRDGSALARAIAHPFADEFLRDDETAFRTSVSDPEHLEGSLGEGPSLLLDPTGRLFLTSRPHRALFADLWKEPGRSLLSRFTAGDEVTLGGQRYVASRIPLTDRGWTLVVLKSAQAVQTYRLIGILFAFVACSLLLALFVHAEVRRESARAVAASEERLRRIFESAPDGIVVFDAKSGEILLVNPPFARWIGSPADELPGKRVRRRALVDVQNQRTAGLRTGKTFRFRNDRVRGKDGTTVYVEAAGTFLPFQGRECVVAFVRDVTDRRRVEEALKVQQTLLVEQKEFSDNLLVSCAVAAFVLGPDGKVLLWNRACEELTSLPASEVVGTDLHWRAFYETKRPCLADFVAQGASPDALDGYYNEYGPSKLHPEGLHAQRWFTTLDGQERYVVFDAAPIRNSRGDLIAVIETLQDLTERERAEEERALLATAVEQAAEVIVIADAAGRLQYANPVFEQVTGFRVAEVLDGDRAVWRSGEVASAEISQALETGDVWAGRRVSRRKDGTSYEEDLTISPVRNPRGKVTHFVGVSRDVSKEVQLEKQLAHAQKFEALGTLAGGIAHDFNNILAVIIGYTELALDEFPDGAKGRRSLEHVLAAGERARDLIRQILAFSRRSEPGPQPLPVAEVVEEVLQLCRATLPATIEIEKRIEAAGSLVGAERTQLHQVLLNLCANAAQAMAGRTGVLTVELDEVPIDERRCETCADVEPGSYVRLKVSDTGCGIEASILDRIFEPFFTTKPVGEGTGMGLAVVHGIVRSCGGDIEVQSRVGVGTTFTLYLPRVREDGRRVPSPKAVEVGGGKERILFVEDEPVLAELGERVLTHLGYRVTVATRGDEAWTRFAAGPDDFDLVITDYGLPGLHGTELARRIHQQRPELPILLCSGYEPDGEPVSVAGIRKVLLKPVPTREFARAIRSALDPPAPRVASIGDSPEERGRTREARRPFDGSLLQ